MSRPVQTLKKADETNRSVIRNNLTTLSIPLIRKKLAKYCTGKEITQLLTVKKVSVPYKKYQKISNCFNQTPNRALTHSPQINSGKRRLYFDTDTINT